MEILTKLSKLIFEQFSMEKLEINYLTKITVSKMMLKFTL